MKLINTHDQLMAARGAMLPDVAIMPKHDGFSRRRYRAGWQVYRPGFNLNPGGRWMEHAKPFEEFDRTREEAFAAAVAWAGRHYKVEKFVRNRLGDWVDHRVNKLFPLPKIEKAGRKDAR